MILMEGHKGGPWVGGKGGRGGRNFLKNHTSTIWSVKSAAKKTNKNQYSPPQKRGGQIFFQFFSLVFVRIMKFDSDMAAKLYFFYVKTKRKKN